MAMICVYCASSEHIEPRYAELATEVGVELARRGHGLVSGGGRQITVAPGAIVVNTQVENPRRVAEAVLDRMTLALV